MSTSDFPVTAIPAVADSAPRLNLVVQKGPQSGTRIPCRRVVTLIGSREGCKVNLRHRRAAPVHSALVNNGYEVVAVDLLTPAGTHLNGLKLQHETLNDGDVLNVGQWELLVEIEQPDSNGNADAHPFDLEPTPNVVALEHLETGRVLQPNRAVCLIGRRNGCDITLPDKHVSRAHLLSNRRDIDVNNIAQLALSEIGDTDGGSRAINFDPFVILGVLERVMNIHAGR